MSKIQKCKVNECIIMLHHAKGYCKKHYYQFLKYGFIPERNKYTKNEIIKYKNYAEIILYDVNNKERARSKIDLEDINKVKNIKWRISKKYILGSNIILHRLLMNTSPNLQVDHINHNALDNRKKNLRNVTQSQNLMNQKSKGIYFNKNQWEVHLQVNKKKYNKSFKTKQKALNYRKELEIKHFGEFRYGCN